VRLFTTAEAAEYLRLKERKLYELVAEGAIPCTKITGRWLFPKDELDRWLTYGLVRPEGLGQEPPTPIVGGSHDPLLEWTLRESGSGLAILAEGSEAGLARYQRGELTAAGIHLHATKNGDGDANVEAVETRPGFHDAVLLGFVRREVGLLVRPGNPMGLTDLKAVERNRARVATRPDGAGAQLLLQLLMHRAGIDARQVALIKPPCPTGVDVAQSIKAGRADCGIAIRAVADGAGLGFVPILWERFDLVVRQREYFRAPMQAVTDFWRTPAVRSYAKELGGYDLSDIGRIRYAH
jgi:excisionase family DNA binding protein